ncbi:MAG: hypothetical protein IEMM0008_1423 [bacterium]|nr:MAG: hypothetical protein IEMM0008_1423 [bacterium]
MKVKMMIVVSLLVMIGSIPAIAHRDMKNIQEGVIHPVKCSSHKNLTVSKTIQCGTQSGFYILSPASRYDIRKQDSARLIQFLKKHQTRNVKIQLVIGLRTEKKVLWKIIKISKR